MSITHFLGVRCQGSVYNSRDELTQIEIRRLETYIKKLKGKSSALTAVY